MRRRIPTDLLWKYQTKEVQRSLRTTDPKVAAINVRRASSDLDDEFTAIRASPEALLLGVNTKSALTVMRTSPETRAGFGQYFDQDDAQQFLDAEANEMRDDADHDAREQAIAAVNRLLDIIDAAIERRPRDTLSAGLQSTRITSPAAVAPVIPRNYTYHSLDVLFSKWELERKNAVRTIVAVQLAVDRFKELVGDLPVEGITKKHVVKFKDELISTGKTAQTARYSLTVFGGLLEFALGQDWIAVNPTRGVTVEVKETGRAQRIAFLESSLNAIFASDLYTKRAKPKGAAGETSYWLPLLGLFTGARIEELCQMSPEDVREESYRDEAGKQHKCWVMVLLDEGEGQNLKNAGSRRRFPIHTELLSRGFIEYVKSRSAESLLFPLKPNKYGRKSAAWSTWWHRKLRSEWGVTDSRQVFHSFRHSFKDICRECGIDKGIRDAIQGHAEKGAAGSYGGEFYPLRPLVEAMSKYRVHGVNLPV